MKRGSGSGKNDKRQTDKSYLNGIKNQRVNDKISDRLGNKLFSKEEIQLELIKIRKQFNLAKKREDGFNKSICQRGYDILNNPQGFDLVTEWFLSEKTDVIDEPNFKSIIFFPNNNDMAQIYIKTATGQEVSKADKLKVNANFAFPNDVDLANTMEGFGYALGKLRIKPGELPNRHELETIIKHLINRGCSPLSIQRFFKYNQIKAKYYNLLEKEEQGKITKEEKEELFHIIDDVKLTAEELGWTALTVISNVFFKDKQNDIKFGVTASKTPDNNFLN